MAKGVFQKTLDMWVMPNLDLLLLACSEREKEREARHCICSPVHVGPGCPQSANQDV